MRSLIKWLVLTAVCTSTLYFFTISPVAQSQEQKQNMGEVKTQDQKQSMGDTKAPELVPYPEGYRMWVHVRSKYVGPDNPNFKQTGGLYHLYANDKAVEGYKNMKFPDGSLIVYDTLEAKINEGEVMEGKHRFVTVMHKDSKRYPKTGGWGFEIFSGDSKDKRVVSTNPNAKCWSCHVSKSDTDHVFIGFRK